MFLFQEKHAVDMRTAGVARWGDCCLGERMSSEVLCRLHRRCGFSFRGEAYLMYGITGKYRRDGFLRRLCPVFEIEIELSVHNRDFPDFLNFPSRFVRRLSSGVMDQDRTAAS